MAATHGPSVNTGHNQQQPSVPNSQQSPVDPIKDGNEDENEDEDEYGKKKWELSFFRNLDYFDVRSYVNDSNAFGDKSNLEAENGRVPGTHLRRDIAKRRRRRRRRSRRRRSRRLRTAATAVRPHPGVHSGNERRVSHPWGAVANQQ